MVEAAIADEGYAGLGRFFGGVRSRLRRGGRILLFFGTSGDQDHVLALVDAAGLRGEVVATRELVRGERTIVYSTFRLTG